MFVYIGKHITCTHARAHTHMHAHIQGNVFFTQLNLLSSWHRKYTYMLFMCFWILSGCCKLIYFGKYVICITMYVAYIMLYVYIYIYLCIYTHTHDVNYVISFYIQYSIKYLNSLSVPSPISLPHILCALQTWQAVYGDVLHLFVCLNIYSCARYSVHHWILNCKLKGYHLIKETKINR